MTCIVAIREKGHVLLAADSCVSFETHRDTVDDKVFRCSGMLIGAAGDALFSQHIEHTLRAPVPKHISFVEFAKKTLSRKVLRCWEITRAIEEESWGELIFAHGAHMVSVTARGEVFVPQRDYLAIGSGATFAYGSLRNSRGDAPTRAIQAINTAAEFLGDVSPPVRMEWTK